MSVTIKIKTKKHLFSSLKKTKGGEDTECGEKKRPTGLTQDMIRFSTSILTLRGMLSIHYMSQGRVRPVFPLVDHRVVFWTVFT